MKRKQYVANAGCVSLSVCHIPCCSPLYHFQSPDINLGVWIPHSTGILDKRSHKHEIGLLFDGDSSSAEIFSQKTNGSVCLVANLLYVSVPFEVFCNCDT